MSLTLMLHIDESFRPWQTQAKQESGLRKGRCWIDFDMITGDTALLRFGKSHMELVYPTARGDCSLSTPYGDVIAVSEMSSGIFIRLKHSRFLFLPVTASGDENRKLMEALILMTEKCRWVYQLAPMHLRGVGLFLRLKYRFRPQQGINLSNNYARAYCLLLVLACFFIGTVFVSMRLRTTDVAQPDAPSFTGVYLSQDPFYSQRRHSYRFLDLEFADGAEYTVDGCCVDSALQERLENLPPGTQMTLLLHPVTDAVLEIQTDQGTLLPFSETLSKLQREASAFFFLGLVIYLCGGYLLWGTIQKKL